MAWVTVNQQVMVEASRERVWETITDPERLPVVDPRVTLVSMAGAPATVASGYVVDAGSGAARRRLEYTVVHVESGVRYTAEVRVAARLVAVQDATLDQEGLGRTALRWEVRVRVPPGRGWLYKPKIRAELSAWMTGVVRESEHVG
jgi:carbon monoxide dehydrogenase subunit G